MSKAKDSGLKQFSAFVSVIAFIADMLTILLFVNDLLFSYEHVSFESTIGQFFLIALIFTFAVLLFNYSREINRGLDSVVRIFGWLYIVLAALIFAIISLRFIMVEDYSLGEFIGYPLLVIAIGGLGFGVIQNVKANSKYLAVPFMLVALEQIILWVIKLFTGFSVFFTLTFFGNLALFIIAGLIILFLLSVDNW